MKLFTCGFIHLKAEGYLHQDHKEKAEILFKKCSDESKGFKPSECWLHRPKKLFTISVNLNKNGEKLSENKWMRNYESIEFAKVFCTTSDIFIACETTFCEEVVTCNLGCG